MTQNNNRLIRIFFAHSFPLLIIIVLMSSGVFYLSKNFLSSKVSIDAENELNQIANYTDTIVDEIYSLNLMLSANPEFVTRLQKNISLGNFDLENYRLYKLLLSFINSPVNAHDYMKSISIYLESPHPFTISSGEGVETNIDLSKTTWYSYYEKLKEKKISLSTYKLNDSTLTQFSLVYDSLNNPIGVIMLNISIPVINKKIESLANPIYNKLEVYSQTGELLLNVLNIDENSDTNNLIFEKKSTNTGWLYKSYIDKNILFDLPNKILRYSMSLLILCFLFGLCATAIINHKERKFINSVLNELKLDDYEIPKMKGNFYEYLSNSIINTFMEKHYYELQKNNLEYKTLQLQINPHFLFNTLDNIYWKAIRLTSNENDVSNMIMLLSNLLKYTIKTDSINGVSLDQEIEMTNEYISLQRIRYKNRFTVKWNIDPNLIGFRIPRLIFQPLIENSLKYGLVEGKTLNIKINLNIIEKNKVEITIKDDGANISDELLEMLNTENDDIKGSIGIRNVRKRLKFFYGEDTSLILINSKTNGVIVKILINQNNEFN